jgi:hypothetical protein
MHVCTTLNQSLQNCYFVASSLKRGDRGTIFLKCAFQKKIGKTEFNSLIAHPIHVHIFYLIIFFEYDIIVIIIIVITIRNEFIVTLAISSRLILVNVV